MEKCDADGSELSFTLPVERIVDNVYRLERRIGAGGMSAVFRATDLRLSRPVAVKIMMGSLFGNQAALQRFEREARAAARLNHPNIVAIHDYGLIGSDGAYLVMELVNGPTLRAELRKTGALPPTQAAAWFQQMLDGLAAAHDSGVVHRDLKPENVIVAQLAGSGELVKILDFGLAKIAAAGDPGTMLTAAGAVLGTLGYMSPEQLLGEEVDARTDTFSVGVMVAEALTGQRPFAGANFQDLLAATLRETYRLPGEGPAVERLDRVLQRCLARERENRPRVGEIRHELVEAVREYPAVAAPAPDFANLSTIDESQE
jgi:serine/threonine-protein kinase